MQQHLGKSEIFHCGIESPLTHRAEGLTFPVQFIKGCRAEHDAFAVFAVIEPQHMAEFVGALLHYPVDGIVEVTLSLIISVIEADG